MPVLQHEHETRLSCQVCLDEIPNSEAGVAEGEEYVLHFCGIDCYERWRNNGDGAAQGNDGEA